MNAIVYDEFQLIPPPNTYGMNSDDMAVIRPYSGSLSITLQLADGGITHWSEGNGRFPPL